MAKYQIDIGVSSRGRGGKSAMSEIKERQAQVRRADQVGKGDMRGRGRPADRKTERKQSQQQTKQSRVTSNLNRNIIKLTRSIEKLDRSTSRTSRLGQRQGRLAQGMARGVSAGGRGASGALGRIGAALPFGVGAIFGVTAFVIKQISKLGQAYIDVTGRQKQAYGVGGFQRGGAFGYFEQAETGQFVKSMRMAAGGRNIRGKGVGTAAQLVGLTETQYKPYTDVIRDISCKPSSRTGGPGEENGVVQKIIAAGLIFFPMINFCNRAIKSRSDSPLYLTIPICS